MSGESRGAEAALLLTKAQRRRHSAEELAKIGRPALAENWEAGCLEARSEELLKPAGEIIRGGGEAMDLDISDSVADPKWGLIDTLRHPDSIGLGASEDRLKLLAGANVLETALDAAESARAGNSLEKMLCHQMAAAHHAALTLIAHAADPQLPPVEMARLTNAAGRMMDVYQAGVLTLQKLRTGGKQTVVVQHVQVSDGGQAVIAGNVNGGGRPARRRGGAGKVGH